MQIMVLGEKIALRKITSLGANMGAFSIKVSVYNKRHCESKGLGENNWKCDNTGMCVQIRALSQYTAVCTTKDL